MKCAFDETGPFCSSAAAQHRREPATCDAHFFTINQESPAFVGKWRFPLYPEPASCTYTMLHFLSFFVVRSLRAKEFLLHLNLAPSVTFSARVPQAVLRNLSGRFPSRTPQPGMNKGNAQYSKNSSFSVNVRIMSTSVARGKACEVNTLTVNQFFTMSLLYFSF